ncbi:MAG: DUF2330 domain-containing protein [Polyangiales bacterium]
MRRILAATALSFSTLFLAPRADAFCGFYVAPSDAPLYADATMVALMREGNRTALSMSNNYKGPPEDFAMVVPVPVVLQKENVKTLPLDVFKKLESLTAPRLVEYWEQDPCYKEPDYDEKKSEKTASAPMAMKAKGKKDDDYHVTIEAQFTVDEYEVVVLSAEESDGLERWLVDNKYKIPKGASSALAPYVKEQMKFFVAKVDATKVNKDDKGVIVLSPLRFHYESADFRLPVRLGLLNAPPPSPDGGGKQDIIVWVLSKDSRYEVANYPNVTIPTNIDVSNDTRESFGPFYAALFDATIAKSGGKAVVTEYSWMSSGCDPCPTPPLGDNEVATLGGDVLLSMAAVPPPVPTIVPPPIPMPSASTKPSAKGGGPPVLGKSKMGGFPGGGFYGGTSRPVVLTRLHARYDASTLTEDLVFKTAPAIVGGREFVRDASGAIEKGAQPSSFNQFQARYAIRHPWTGPITCANPKRGVWGGPPPEVAMTQPTTFGPVPATNLAAAPRGKVELTHYVLSRVEELDLKQAAKPAAAKPTDTIPSEPPAFGAFMYGVLGALAVVGLASLALRKKA